MMKTLELKPTHKAVRSYYEDLEKLGLFDQHTEGSVATPFATLLNHCAGQLQYTLATQYTLKRGNRSMLHWVIDQYQMKVDKRSGIVNDPNRVEDPEYIVRLIGQVVEVSVETVKIVKALPEWAVE